MHACMHNRCCSNYTSHGSPLCITHSLPFTAPQVHEGDIGSFLAQLRSFDPAQLNTYFADAMAPHSQQKESTGAGTGTGTSGGGGGGDGSTYTTDDDQQALQPLTSLAAPEGMFIIGANLPPGRKAAAWREGLLAIAQGKVGALILAGGQATRLGASVAVKGEFDDSLPSHTPLFEMFAERVVRLKTLAADAAGLPEAKVSLPLYIMTSDATDAETRRFFGENAFFGLPPADVMFFRQAMMPCFSRDGKVLLESPCRLSVAPGGNGGLFKALADGGILADMGRRGVEGLHVSPVDNIACRIADPLFTGLCIQRGAHVGSKVVRKAGPYESVGLLALKGGRLTAVEYSELDAATAEQRDPDTGRLAFDSGNCCIHYFSVPFLRAAAAAACPSKQVTSAGSGGGIGISSSDVRDVSHHCTASSAEMWPQIDETDPATWPLPSLRYHAAFKYIPRVDPSTGLTLRRVDLEALGREEGQGVKLESLAFDTFPFIPLSSLLVLEVDRAEEFAPIKNASGAAADTPETARTILSALHRRWLEEAGAVVIGAPEARVEVHPLASYAGEGLTSLAGRELRAPLLVALAKPVSMDSPLQQPPQMQSNGTSPAFPQQQQAAAAGDASAAGTAKASFIHTYAVSPMVSLVMVSPAAHVPHGSSASASRVGGSGGA